MRQIGLSDLHHAAWAVRQQPAPQQTAFCARLIWRAHVADKYVKRMAKLHPAWGDGSLRAAVISCCGPANSGLRGEELQAGIAVVLGALRERRDDSFRQN
ncbi:DUF7742 family protein [Sulfitobacter aquimarinus]|uniref:DUF7742 family protein n=1 Tax=Sulfitobacter aquimarinus TaxID=3158557 RepID=UPI003F70FDD9